jgi:hypothetical protein
MWLQLQTKVKHGRTDQYYRFRYICQAYSAIPGGLRKLHNEELHNFYSSSRIIRLIKSRRRRWEGYVARIGEKRMHIGYWWESQMERGH